MQTNDLKLEDRAAHGWYRFVLSYPPHLVRDYLQRFSVEPGQTVLDPFCGTGTTLVECKKLGISSVGIEANPIAHFATSVKVDWSPAPKGLLEHGRLVAESAYRILSCHAISDTAALPQAAPPNLLALSPEGEQLILTDSISPLPLHKALVLLNEIENARDDCYYRHERLAFAKSVVFASSNLAFGPEVGVGKIKLDSPVIAPWLTEVRTISDDLNVLAGHKDTPALAYLGDSRQVLDHLDSQSIDVVITSPPYPNEKDYTRTTRLESVLLGFLRNSADLREVKRELVRSNTRSIYVEDEDDLWVTDNVQVQRLAEEIDIRRRELGKTSGFEKQYPRLTRLYFGGMARHLAELRRVLRPGAQLAYVVGDQASYLQVMIRTGQLLATIAESLGYEVVNLDLFRTRLATATKAQLREEVLVLRWPGTSAPAMMAGVDFMKTPSPNQKSTLYNDIIEHIFLAHFQPGMQEFEFAREEITEAASTLAIKLPKNLGDVIYSFRYRTNLPEAVLAKAPEGQAWTIQPAGRGRYRFTLRSILESPVHVVPNALIPETKIPDATPGIIAQHALNDEQALLAKLRYNRLIDMFTGITCYSLQNHLRTTVPGMGQVETDELYVGVNEHGAQFVLPVQAKGGTDKINVVQVEQDHALCANKFPELICIPIAAQFMADDVIALFSFEQAEGHMMLHKEHHYRLVPPDEVTAADLVQYRQRFERE